jgi:hypothetical protein
LNYFRFRLAQAQAKYALHNILEKIETPRGMRRSFCLQRTGESRFMPDSPVSAGILSVRSKTGSLQRLNTLWWDSPTIAAPEDRRRKIPIDRVCVSENDAAANRQCGNSSSAVGDAATQAVVMAIVMIVVACGSHVSHMATWHGVK